MLENTYDFSSLRVLDLFGGGGGISLEFVSRGCPRVTCIEMNPLHARFIKDTARFLAVSDQLQVVHHNVFDFLKICTLQYNLVFADPPYDIDALETIPDTVLSSGVLEPGAPFILEHPAKFSFADHPRFVKEKKYGNVHFTFFC